MLSGTEFRVLRSGFLLQQISGSFSISFKKVKLNRFYKLKKYRFRKTRKKNSTAAKYFYEKYFDSIRIYFYNTLFKRLQSEL